MTYWLHYINLKYKEVLDEIGENPPRNSGRLFLKEIQNDLMDVSIPSETQKKIEGLPQLSVTSAIVVGNKVVAAMRRVAQGDEFRSNVHRGGKTEPVELDKNFEYTD